MGERVWEIREGMKEIGKTTMVLLLTQYECTFATSRYIRYVHSDHNQVTEFLNAIYNFFLKPQVRSLFGDLISDRGKDREKKRYTQSLINLRNGVTIKGMTSLQTGVGTVDLDTKTRVQTQIIDDPSNVLRALSDAHNTKDKRVVDELVRGCDQAESSVLILCNALEPYDLVQEVKKDKRFTTKRYFLFQDKEEKAENLLWPAKYAMTPYEAWQRKGKRRVSVASLRDDPDYRKSFLGELIPEDSRYFTGTFTEQNYTTDEYGVRLFAPYVQGHHYALGADSSEGVGRDEQALTLLCTTTNHVVATFQSDTITTDAFAELIVSLATRYGNALLAPENDRAQGALLIHLLLETHQYTNIWREQEHDKATSTTALRYGYVPTQAKNRLLYSTLRNSLPSITVGCPFLIRELTTTTRAMLSGRDSTRTFGAHRDLLRSFAIANYVAADADAFVGIL